MESVSRPRRWRLFVGVVVLALLAIPTAGMVVGGTTPFQQVIVANPPTSPIPVSLTGSNAISGTVNVGNLPATQPVSGTVNVGNLPATQPVSGTVNVGNSPTVQLASNSTVTVVNPTGDQPLLVQEVGSTTLSPAEILPPTGGTIIGPAREYMPSRISYRLFASEVPINFCITAVFLDTNGEALYQAGPANNFAVWHAFQYDHPLARCEANKQYVDLDNLVAGTALVFRIDRIP